MKIIDSHLHLDRKRFPNVADAAKELSDQLRESSIEKGLILHLEIQKWSPEELSEAVRSHDNLEAFFNVHPDNPIAKDELKRAINELGFCGLKLHPRIQNLDFSSEKLKELVRYAGELRVPTLIDAFPDGTALMNDFRLLDYSDLALACPDSKIIWAHMGGHHVIDMMMLAKRLPNVYFDFSYSLLYYRGSSVPQDMVYAMKSMRWERIFYGSDYPDRSIKESLDSSIEVLKELGVNDEQMQKIFYSNFVELMKW